MDKFKPVLKGYTNVDMVGDLDSRNSTSCYLTLLQEELCLSSQDCRTLLLYL